MIATGLWIAALTAGSRENRTLAMRLAVEKLVMDGHIPDTLGQLAYVRALRLQNRIEGFVQKRVDKTPGTN